MTGILYINGEFHGTILQHKVVKIVVLPQVNGSQISSITHANYLKRSSLIIIFYTLTIISSIHLIGISDTHAGSVNHKQENYIIKGLNI